MSRQAQFYQALLSDEPITLAGLRTCNDSDPASRFAVYRNNVQRSLIEALAANFPVVQALVGEEFFRAMARLYVQRHPPGAPVLAGYGEQMPAFIDQFQPARELPYLADVARLELSRIHAYHAADADVLDHTGLARQIGEHSAPEQLVLHLHPSLQVLSSTYAVHSLWAAHQGALAIEQVAPYQPEHCLVLRQHLEVLVIAVDAASAAVISRLNHGRPLGQAAADCPAGFDLSQCLALLIRHGAICAVSTSTTE